MNKCICFVFDGPIQNHMRKTCFFDEFLENGYRLVLIDLSFVIDQAAYNRVNTDLIESDYTETYHCKSKKEFIDIMNRMPSHLLVFTRMQWSTRTYWIFRILEHKSIPYGYISVNEINDLKIIKKARKSYLRNYSVRDFLQAVFVRIPRRLLLRKGASFIICNFRERFEIYKTRYTATNKTDCLLLHSSVYEEALKIRNEERLIKERYCVWLDTYTPYHSDGLRMGTHVNPKNYYASLNIFFAFLEEIYKLKVVIAAHPKADYEKHKDAYDGYRIEKFKTCLLCRDAEFVITSVSMSTMYAVLYKKPLFFAVQDALGEGGLDIHVKGAESMSSQLGTKVINIDHYSKTKKELDDILFNISEESYNKRIKEWIKEDYDGTISGESCIPKMLEFLDRFY